MVLDRADGGKGELRWEDVDNGKTITHDSDPEATTKRRMEVSVIKLLPVESLL